MERQMNGITQAILKLRINYAEFDHLTPQAINNGLCGNFANDLVEMGFGEAVWGDDACPCLWSSCVMGLPDWFTHFTGGHCFLDGHNGKFYDSECPQGCNYPDELPFYQRQIIQFYGEML